MNRIEFLIADGIEILWDVICETDWSSEFTGERKAVFVFIFQMWGDKIEMSVYVSAGESLREKSCCNAAALFCVWEFNNECFGMSVGDPESILRIYTRVKCQCFSRTHFCNVCMWS